MDRPKKNNLRTRQNGVDESTSSNYTMNLKAPVKPLPPIPVAVKYSIDKAPWYWGDLHRDEAKEKMCDSLDGTYLVRDSSNKEESAPYTLILRKDGKNLLIKIYHSGGKYDIMEPPRFGSVKQLIDHYSSVSLIEFNKRLNIKLQNPFLKPVEQKPSEKRDLKELRKDFKHLNLKHSKLELELTSLQEEEDNFIEMCEKALMAIQGYKSIIVLYAEHEKELSKKKYFNEVLKCSTYSLDVMKERMAFLNQTLEIVEMELSQSNDNLKCARITALEKKSEIIKCFQEKDNVERLLLQCGETSENVALMKESWFLLACDRGRSKELLRGREVGTFLIRQRSEEDSYALSIVSPNQEVVHCRIDRKESGYGFAEPYYVHSTLLDLVLHYKVTSLKEHNEHLNITLKYPVDCVMLNSLDIF